MNGNSAFHIASDAIHCPSSHNKAAAAVPSEANNPMRGLLSMMELCSRS
jgi:hypothetical protein